MVENIKQYSEHERYKYPNNTFWIEAIGCKYKMSNIQVALSLTLFERIIPNQLIQFLDKVPLKKMGEPEDRADFVYVLTLQNNFISG